MTGVYEVTEPDNNTGLVEFSGTEYHIKVASDLNTKRLLGVLAGRDFSTDRVAQWARTADVVFAADGGADLLFEHGIVPDATVGDFDSIGDSTKDAQKTLIHAPDQSSSDCEKLMKLGFDWGFRKVTLCSLEGDLVDHILGTLQSAAKSPMEVRLVTRKGIVRILKGPSRLAVDVPIGTRLSLLPLVDCQNVSLSGVEWPLKDTILSPLGLSSLSNRTLGTVEISLDSGVAGLFLAHPSLEIPHWT